MGTVVHANTSATALAIALEHYQTEHCGQPVETVTDTWASFVINPAVVVGWTPEQSANGLRLLEQLSRTIDAAKLVLIGQLDAGRDTTATIVRTTGISTSNARELRRAAKVINEHPDALNKLAEGSLTTEHLAKVSHLKSDLAAELIETAHVKSADEFRRFVDETRIQRDSASVSDEQHNSRSVKIYTKRNGCIGINIVLPPVEGNELHNTLQAIADQTWRAAHPERATVNGGHHDEPHEQRLADALISWMRNGNTATGKPAVIVIINAETLNAHVVPHQPIPINDALIVMEQANVYAAIRDGTNIANLTFGRNKRIATPLQRLALLTQTETCQAPGCTVTALNCDIHHVNYFEHGGLSNLENYQFLCRGQQGHHPHQHETQKHTNTQAA
jgi:hypothetical protein